MPTGDGRARPVPPTSLATLASSPRRGRASTSELRQHARADGVPAAADGRAARSVATAASAIEADAGDAASPTGVSARHRPLGRPRSPTAPVDVRIVDGVSTFDERSAASGDPLHGGRRRATRHRRRRSDPADAAAVARRDERVTRACDADAPGSPARPRRARPAPAPSDAPRRAAPTCASGSRLAAHRRDDLARSTSIPRARAQSSARPGRVADRPAASLRAMSSDRACAARWPARSTAGGVDRWGAI